MSSKGLLPFEDTLQTSNIWLRDLMKEMGWEDRYRAYHALRAVLHALRDRLTVGEAADLGAQLPMLVRGFYYEGWHPAGKPLKERTKEQFLAHIAKEFRGDPPADLEAIVKAVFWVVGKHVTAGEIEDVKHLLPPEIRSLWPTEGEATSCV